jgi:lipopolysaccharide/colanic/teichoic acid biosynthesis glycosyltransferase/UDP-N-acetylglucosamine:LPS N-acetylglucosamine transferase
MRVLYIDQYFSTRKGISGTRSYEFARKMIKQGHTVTIITSASRYSSLYPQTQLIRRLDIEGIRVISARIDYSQKMGFLRRLWAFALFMCAATVLGIFEKRHDVVFATSTPLLVALPGMLIGLVRGTPFVFEVRDLWPRAPIELGVIANRFAIAALRVFEKVAYKAAKKIVALSPGMAKGIAETGIDEAKITVIPNAADLDLFDPTWNKTELRKHCGYEEAFVAVYAGTVGPANDLCTLIDVARFAQEQSAGAVQFRIIGEGNELSKVKSYAKEKGVTTVYFVDAMDRKSIAPYIAAADLGLTLFKDLPVLATNSPNKFFDYLAAGIPCAVNTPGWTADEIKNADAGIYLDPKNPEAAARAICDLAKDPARAQTMGQNARALAAQKFERGLLLDRLVGVLKSAMQPRAFGLEQLAKSGFDFLASLIGLIVLSPAILAIALAIKLDSPGPVLFRQKRVCRNGRFFSVFKFRTMTRGAAEEGLGLNVEAGDSRITKVGHFLREWSLDELPQLINVLLFQMSIVGPRPTLPEQVEKYDAVQKRRLLVKPGLTGLAQVSGRNALPWARRIEFDVKYVDDFSLRLDLSILLKTAGVILSRQGLYESDAGKDDDFNKF